MLLKKQTVWLLTMLSLVVVLSVYYVTSDPGLKEMATGDEQTEKEVGQNMSEDDIKIITEAAGDEAYETARLTLQDQRGKQIEGLTTQLAAPELTTDEKNKLYDEMEQLGKLEQKEKVIETNIKGLGYSDALVKIENDQVNVTVKSDAEHSRTEAVEILQIVREEVGTQYVALVDFDVQAEKKE